MIRLTLFLGFAFWGLQAQAQGCKRLFSVDATAPIERFVQVKPGLYRGAHPSTPEAFAFLLNGKKITTLINLQGEKEEQPIVDHERSWALANSINFVYEPLMSSWNSIHLGSYSLPIPDFAEKLPDDATVLRVLTAMKNASLTNPTFIHCLHGKDRTGVMVALYQVFELGVSPQIAYQQMKQLGFTPLEFRLWQYWKINGKIGSPLWKKWQEIKG